MKVERFIQRDKYILHQEKELISRIDSMIGERFHSEVVDHCMAAASREEFWLDISTPSLYSILLHEGPYRSVEVEILDIGSFISISGISLISGPGL